MITSRKLDEESQAFLEQLGLLNIDHSDQYHSVWRGFYGNTPFDIYIPLEKSCTDIGELLYYVRGDGIGLGIKMEREKIFQKIKNNIQRIIFGDRHKYTGSYSNKDDKNGNVQEEHDPYEGRSDGGE